MSLVRRELSPVVVDPSGVDADRGTVGVVRRRDAACCVDIDRRVGSDCCVPADTSRCVPVGAGRCVPVDTGCCVPVDNG